MASLRSQLILLVFCCVLGALSALAYVGRRSAMMEFRSSVESITSAERVDMPDLQAAYTTGGWNTVREVLTTRPPGASPANVLVVRSDGEVIYSADSILSKTRGTLARDGGESFMFESTEPGKIVRLQLSGGLPILDGERVVGRSFPLPPVGGASLDGESQTFVARLSRSMLVAAALLLVVATLAAWAISTRILGPIAALRAAAERIGSGDFTGRVGKVRMRELRPLAESFDGMAAGLSRSEGLRRQFVRDIAHELRSPLTNLQGQIEALQDRLTEPTTDALSSLHEETMLLQRLVADLDALARADAGELALRRERVAVVDELRRIVDGFVRAGRAREGALEVAGDASVFVNVDRERLGQMVRNVIENALTHGAGPGIIQLRAVKGAEFVDVIVQDNGSGIPAEHANRVWERLYRPDDARTRAHGGSGLGLAIVKSLVEAHGGRVSLKSEPGKGTLVTLSFPAVPDNEMRPAGLSDGQ